MKVRQTIEFRGWVEGSGYSYTETYEDEIIDIGSINDDCDWDWFETDSEVQEYSDSDFEESDTEIIVKLFAIDADITVDAPIKVYRTWESEIVKARKEEN